MVIWPVNLSSASFRSLGDEDLITGPSISVLAALKELPSKLSNSAIFPIFQHLCGHQNQTVSHGYTLVLAEFVCLFLFALFDWPEKF